MVGGGRIFSHAKRVNDSVMKSMKLSTTDHDLWREHAHAYPRKIVARDDILDALVAAVTGMNELRTVPGNPEVDSCGLPMEMVYSLVEAAT